MSLGCFFSCSGRGQCVIPHHSGYVRGTRCRVGGGIELVHFWLIVLLVDGIVDGEGVGFGGSANGDAYHGFRLEGGATLVIVQVLVEVRNGEER